MSYSSDILALSPDHFWTWDGNHNDLGVGPSAPKPTNQAGGNTAIIDGNAICKDSTTSLTVKDRTHRTECADSAEINQSSQERRTMGGWFKPSEIARSPSSIYKEGGGGNNIAFLLGFGNTLQLQAVSGSNFDIQCYSDITLRPGRAYHILFVLSGNGYNNELVLYLDGIRQEITSPNIPSLDRADMPGHGSDINWGQPDGALNIGGTRRGFNGAEGEYSHWASWTTILTEQQIREELFEKGALPTHTVTSQAELDALANTTLPNAPLSILVDFSGDISLDATNIEFNDSTSIHVQYNGSGTLTWTNLGTSNASIASSIGGGSVVLVNPARLTLTGIKDGSEVRVYESGTTNEIAGVESITGGVFITSTLNPSVDVVVHSLEYIPIRINNVDMSQDTSIPIQQIADRQYENV